MIINAMTIRVYTSNTERTDLVIRSPECRRSSGWRMKIGWNILRIGAYIMFGKGWTSE